MNKRKLLKKILSGSKNVHFRELQILVEAFGFRLDRIKGSHHIYLREDIRELINLQNVRGRAKPYQVKQFLAIVEKHNLQLGENE